MKRYKREFYEIRLLDNVGQQYRSEFHSSNNGTCEWGTTSKVKAVITRGIQGGHRGMIKTPFANYEVVKFTETVSVKEEVIQL
jgi:hypothetical protein